MPNPNVEEFKRLYAQFYDNVEQHYTKSISPFFMQWGERYDSSSPKCLFIGKAVNGWVTDCRDVVKLFDTTNDDRIYMRSDQIKWVADLAQNKSGYNSRRSAFWRVVERVTKHLFPDDEWYLHIAWTNIYKFAPERGNPPSRLKKAQYTISMEILDQEIECLNPDAIIFLTSGWERIFLDYKKLGAVAKTRRQWSRYDMHYFATNGRLFIVSKHPQGKDENAHSEAIASVIREQLSL